MQIVNTKLKYLELLSPAKNLECGIAAITHGADAVYIGAEQFGARVSAGNSLDDIRKLCDFAHLYSAKVYVTVNTIVYDNELSSTCILIEQLKNIGVDAVIVQDMAVAEMVKGIGLHASTQMDNKTVEKVRWLSNAGFSRAVLARELSLSEIQEIHENVPDIELECFVHGALCVSYSGQCYASHHCFGRSANRGECAQFCRLPFDLTDAEGNVIQKNKYLLSLCDLNNSQDIDRLIQSGVTSFKIEGRLKDINYVKNVTAAYSVLLDSFISRNSGQYRRSSLGRCCYSFTPDLAKTFNRGYTSYFLHGRIPNIYSPYTPKSLGENVGHVKDIGRNFIRVSSIHSFSNGDGLCFFNSNDILEGFRVNKVEANKLYLTKIPVGLTKGTTLYRNQNQDFERQLSRNTSERRIPVDFSIDVIQEGFMLKVSAGSNYTSSLPILFEHQQALSPQGENIVRQLSKLGNTVFECRKVVLPDDFQYFIPSSILAKAKQEIVDDLGRIISKNRLVPERQSVGVKAISSYPEYSVSYLYNASNSRSVGFYNKIGVNNISSAFETCKYSSSIIMQCKHCIKFSLGACKKHGGVRPKWVEPLYLVMADGRKFQLDFDCKKCVMNVLSGE